MSYLSGPVQSIVGLTCSLMTNSLTLLTKVFSSTLIFLLQNVSSFSNAKATQTFAAKNIDVFDIFQEKNFNIMLTNNFVQI